MKKKIFPYVAMCYIVAFGVTSAGTINYAFANGEHLYTITALMNLAFGIYATIRMYKWSKNNTI